MIRLDHLHQVIENQISDGYKDHIMLLGLFGTYLAFRQRKVLFREFEE